MSLLLFPDPHWTEDCWKHGAGEAGVETMRRITMFGIETQGGKSQGQKADSLLNITQ